MAAPGASGVNREVVAEVYEFSRSRGPARQVLRELAEHANAQREAWPSVARLAERTNLSARTVQRALRQLVDELHEIEIVKVGGGKRRPTRYRLVPRMGATQLAFDGLAKGSQPAGVSAAAKGVNHDRHTQSSTTPKGVTGDTQTLKKRDREELPPVRPPSRGPNDGSLLDRVKEQLRGRLTDVTIFTWVEPVAQVAYDGGTLTVRAPDHIVGWVRERFAPLFAETASGLEGHQVAVVVSETDEERADKVASKAKARRRFQRAEKRLAADPQVEAGAS